MKTLSTTLHTLWERGHVNPIFSANIAGDLNKVMKHVLSLCVLCNPCYSRQCYGQIWPQFGLAYSTTVDVWERIEEKHLHHLA